MATDGTIPDPQALLAHSGWVRDLARALVFDPNRVDDVVQETWLAAISQSRDDVRNPRAWLGGIARNVVRETNRSDSRRRGREGRVVRESPDEDCAPAADDLVLRAEQQTRVVQAVLQLAEPYRSTLLMHYFDDLPLAEIGRRTQESASTVRTLARARAAA